MSQISMLRVQSSAWRLPSVAFSEERDSLIRISIYLINVFYSHVSTAEKNAHTQERHVKKGQGFGCPDHCKCTKWPDHQLEVGCGCDAAVQPQRPIFNLTPSTHLTAFCSDRGNDTIHRGRSYSTFLAWFPPHSSNPSIMCVTANIFQDCQWSAVKRNKGSHPQQAMTDN